MCWKSDVVWSFLLFKHHIGSTGPAKSAPCDFSSTGVYFHLTFWPRVAATRTCDPDDVPKKIWTLHFGQNLPGCGFSWKRKLLTGESGASVGAPLSENARGPPSDPLDLLLQPLRGCFHLWTTSWIQNHSKKPAWPHVSWIEETFECKNCNNGNK